MGGQFRGGRTSGWRTGKERKMEGMRGKETFRLRSGLERVERKWKGNGRGGGRETGSGGMRAALRKEKGSDNASGDGSTAMGDPEKRELGRRINLGGT